MINNTSTIGIAMREGNAKLIVNPNDMVTTITYKEYTIDLLTTIHTRDLTINGWRELIEIAADYGTDHVVVEDYGVRFNVEVNTY